MTGSSVTVLGLGARGRALAGAFRHAGRSITVWNRTPSKTGELVAIGARHAGTVADAVRENPLTVVCLLDYDAVRQALTPAGDDAAAKHPPAGRRSAVGLPGAFRSIQESA